VQLILAQFVSYGFTISLFGKGKPWGVELGTNFMFWVLFSPAILVYLTLASLIVTRVSESTISNSKPVLLLQICAYGLFGALGVYALGFTIFSWLFDESYSNFTIADLCFVMLIPGSSFLITKRFSRHLLPTNARQNDFSE
jgi:hypothetical protein